MLPVNEPSSNSTAAPRRHIVKLLGWVVLGILTFQLVSVTRYVVDHPGDAVQQNVASWARNNHLGVVVDALEAWLHSDPPSTASADSLALVLPLDETLSSTPTVSTDVDSSSTTPTVPPDIAPPIVPALYNEGKFEAIAKLRGNTVIWATSLRPLPDVGSVTATVVVFDARNFRAALFNGTETPGGRGWSNGSKVPKEALPALIAAFNGGFRFEHKPGGYVTEGKMLRPLKAGYATLAIDRKGLARLGVYGEDIINDGQWVTLRQNLPPLVKDGVSVYRDYKGVDWGDNFGKVVFTYRSAVCMRHDGLMSYVVAGIVDIQLFVRTLVVAGCKLAMELDINGTWPQFATYSGFGTTSRAGQLVDRRMGHKNRFITKATKDFFALFDPVTLPEGILK